MKVGITTDYMDKQRTGIGNYTKFLIKSLLELENSYNIDLYPIHYRKSMDPLYDKMNEILVPMLPIPPRKVLTNIFRSSHFLNEIDLVHVTAPNPSDNIGILLSNTVKKVITIHDLCIFSDPMLPKIYANPSIWMLYKIWKSTLSYAIKRADRIISVSDNTKKDIIKYLNVSEDLITVIHLAADERFKILDDLSRDDIDYPFILCDSSVPPDLIKTFYKLKKKGICQKLVVFGDTDITTRKNRENLIKDLALEGEVIFLGYITDEKLVELYNLADLFIFPSCFCEGFGLPPLEAMACGTPVITGRVGTMQEVLKDAAVNVDLFNIDEWVNAIYNVLTNEDLRENLINRGIKRAKMFSWDKTAKKTVDVYKKVYNC